MENWQKYMYVLDTLEGVSKRMAYYILDWCSFLPIVGGINSQSWLEKSMPIRTVILFGITQMAY